FETQDYLNCCSRTHTDPDGVTIEYTLNGLGQVIKKEKKGAEALPVQNSIFTIYEYDASGNLVRQSIQNSEANPILIETQYWKYDLAGRLIETEQVSGPTTSLITQIEYLSGPNGTVENKTLPNGASEIATYFPDGQIKSLTGTGVIHQYYDYGVVGQIRFSEVRTGGPTSKSYERTLVDAVGRVKQIERPGFGD